MAGRAVLFDLDNTLYSREAALKAFVRHQYEAKDFAAYGFRPEVWERRFLELDAGGRVWKDAVYQALRQEFALRQTTAELLLDYEQNFAAHAEPAPGVGHAIRTLKDRGWRVGIVTNGRTAFQTRTLAGLGLEDVVETFIVSEAVDLRKPEAAIFHEALRALEARAEGSWFVGDDPVADLQGATDAGLRALHFDAADSSRVVPGFPRLPSFGRLREIVDP